MKISKIQINDFLQSSEPLMLYFVDEDSIIGNILISQPNGWGKSTILYEIKTFFTLLSSSNFQKNKYLKYSVKESLSTTIYYKLSGNELIKFIEKYPDFNNDDIFGYITITYDINENLHSLKINDIPQSLKIEFSNTKHVELFNNIGNTYALIDGLNIVILNDNYRESVDYILIKLQKFIIDNQHQLTKFEQIFNKICFPLTIERNDDTFIFKHKSNLIQYSLSLGELQILKILIEFFSIIHIKDSIIMIDDLNRNLSNFRYTELLKFIQFEANRNNNQLIITETGEKGNLIFTGK
jgi:hypothetical protein